MMLFRRLAPVIPRLRQAIRVLRDRRVYFQRGDDFHYFVVRRWQQIALATVPMIGLCATAVIGGLIHHREVLNKQHDRQVNELLNSYSQLALEFRHAQERFISAAEEVEDKYRRLRTGAANGGVPSDLVPTEDLLTRIVAERANTTQNRERLTNRVAALHAQLANEQAARRFREKSQQIEAQWEWLDQTRLRAVSEIGRLEAAIKATGLDVAIVARAAAKSGETATGQGGPYIGLAHLNEEMAGVGVTTEDFQDELQNLDADYAYIGQLRDALRSVPLGPPVVQAWLSSRYGRRRDPITNRLAFHAGIDFSGMPGTPVAAAAPGVVTMAGRNGPYGQMIEIDHGSGFKTRYGHLRKILVQRNTQIDAGQIIGTMGSSGRSTGTHLHYEVRYQGKNLNPIRFIEAGRHVHDYQTADATGNQHRGDNPERH